MKVKTIKTAIALAASQLGRTIMSTSESQTRESVIRSCPRIGFSALIVALLLPLLPLFAWFTPAPARAGDDGRVNSGDRTIDITVNFRFAPTADHIIDMQNRLVGASQLLWDASEGQLRLGRVKLTCDPAASGAADVWSYLEYGRTQSAVSGLGVNGLHVDYCFLPGDTSGAILAHELGHLALGLWDEHEDPSRCIGQCIADDGVTPTDRNG